MLIRYLLSLFAAVTLAGQSQVREFEVATVKPVSPSGRQSYFQNSVMADVMVASGGPGTKDPGQINYPAVNLRMLLARAYDMKRYQVVGPSWLDTEFYNIVAKLPPGTTKEQLGPMLQRLVTERFRMETHRESRSMRVYTLTVAKGGPRLPPASAAAKAEAEKSGREDRQAALEQAVKAARARVRESSDAALSGPTFHLARLGATVAEFARLLSQNLNEPVIDQTGVEGKYNFDLNWTSDEQMIFTGQPMYWPAGSRLFSAMRDQLGLNLEPGKGPVEVLVIDKAEKTPTEN